MTKTRENEFTAESAAAAAKKKKSLESEYMFYDVTRLKVRSQEYCEQEVEKDVAKSDETGEAIVPEEDEAMLLTKYSNRRVKGGFNKKLVSQICKVKRLENLKAKKIQAGRDKFGLNSKYELSVVYEKPNGKLGVRKILFGEYGEPTLETMEDVSDVMRKSYCKLLLDHAGFDLETYVKFGRFFNKKFWHLNLCWNKYLHGLPPAEQLQYMSERIKTLA